MTDIQESAEGQFVPDVRLSDVTEPAVWDDPASLRGQLLTEEHLTNYGARLAQSHLSAKASSSARPLKKRFRETRGLIQKAYATLAEGAERKRDPSPAEVWLLDNSHVVEGQLREIDEDLPWGYLVKLPRMDRGPMRGYPLVYSLCLGYLRHTDCHVDFRSLTRFVDSYQTVRVLTIGELWAIPIMLRLGLVLAVGALALSEANAEDRDRADAWARRLLGPAGVASSENPEDRLRERDTALRELEAIGADERPSDALLVTLLKRLRERDDAPTEALAWIAKQTELLGTTPEELARRFHLRQAADQVSVGNAITSMRSINNLDWNDFFAATSYVEAILSRDPSGAYPAMDEASRDRCRHAVERMARRSPFSETQIAERALDLSRTAVASERCKTHVGYYLVDDGCRELGAEVRYRPRLGARVLGSIERHPALFYLTTIALLSAGLAALAWLPLFWLQPASWVHLLLLPAILLGTSEIATAITNALVVTFVPPRLLPKYRFDDGIPAEHVTLVVVPTLLTNSEGLRQLVEELEVRSLANTDEHLYFALLTDFPDAAVAETPEEAELVEQAGAAIAELNAGRAEPRYFFFHRRRIENPHEANPKRRFSAWERKRGKLHELNRLLRGDTSTTFQVVSAPSELLARVRYVITLDTDTELPLGVARRLVGALAHPLNRPVVDPVAQRVVRGHAVIQPRVGTSPTSARRSFFARLAAGPPGIDPYTTAVSDVYQDLFGEGTFVGKGIYDVDAYEAAMRGRVPDNQLLSHDLFESIYARSALASDIEVFDEQPAAYAVAAGRQHRWTRGDWQLLPWFRRSVPAREGRRPYDFRAFDVWRVFDNLRRSLLAPGLVLLATLCWFGGSSAALVGTSLILAVFIIPVLGRLAFAFARSDSQLEWLGGLGGDLKNNAQQAFLSVVFLLDQAILSGDAIVRSLYRQLLSRRNLLEWTSMRDASSAGSGSLLQVPRLLVVSALAALLFAGVAVWAPASLPVAAPFLGLWLVSPWVAVRVSKTIPLTVAEPWGMREARSFRRIARKTWRFFERFVGDTDHHLPPDNYQEDPKGVIAHRTSPTNMGLYLLTVASARDLGFITLTEAIERWGKSLATIELLEKRDGHVLNWYDTKSLAPLEPRYVSSVDSGNLAGYLWTLSAACREAQVSPLLSPHTLEAARDAVCLAAEAVASAKGSEPARTQCQRLETSLSRAIEGCASDPTALGRALRKASSELSSALEPPSAEDWPPEAVYWLEVARRTLDHGLELLDACLPQLRGLEGLRSALADVIDASLSPEFEELVQATHAAANPRDVLQQAEQHKGLARSITGRLGARLDGQVRWALEKFERDLDRSAAEARRIHERLDGIAARAEALVDSMDFAFLYDEERSLFSIGYNVGAGRLDNSHYDLLASECRLASLVAIAKGDVPQKHWFRLGRLRAKYASHPGLLSWSGSMFEYLMPLLVMRSFPDTLLDQTYHAAIERQMKHAQKFGVPWGISEAAYNVMDLSMNYQYRAFGVPELGLKPGLGDDLLVAPYATALAALVRARAAHENFGALARADLEGSFGFYESVDYTPARLPPGRKRVVVKAYMAHHQGMILVALSNLLSDFAMQRRFHADARVKACALLLEERIPARAGIAQLETQRPRPRLATALDDEAIEILGFEQVRSGEVRAHLLGQGDLSTWVTAAGDGFTRWRGFDLSRFREDPAVGSGGVYLYVRNLGAGRLWSNGYLPTRSEPDYYATIFSLDKIELQRRDGSIETSTEIVLSPEHAAEIRRVTFTNHGAATARLDVTTFTELCLSSRAADVAHPAFQKIFVGTEFLEARGALIAHRRKRTQHEPEIWVAQMLMSDSAEVGALEVCTSRADFLGRGGDLAEPQGLSSGAFGKPTSGSLDPALVLRRPLELPPNARAHLTLVTLMAESRAALLGLIDLYTARHSIPRAFELAWADARVELRHLNVTAQRALRYQRLLSAVVFPNPALRGSLNPPIGLRGRDALWSQGISGDLPIVVLRLDDPEFSGICRDVLLAHEYWRLNGVESDLVILNEEAPGYLQPVQEAVLSLIRTTPAEGHVDQRGGVFVRRTNLIAEQDLQLLLSAARVVLSASGGSLSRQLRNLAPKHLWKHPPSKHSPSKHPPSKRPPAELLQRSGERIITGVRAKPVAATHESAVTPVPGELVFRNAFGGFDVESGDYVLEIGPGQRPPQPWSNVMAGPRFGTLVTEAGSSFTWYENSQKYRLTPWSNDATLDPSGEAFFLRDHADDATWSLTPAPRGGDASYVVRHGQGRSSFTHTRRELEQTLSVAVSLDDPVKVWHLKLHNHGASKKTLSVVGLVEWVLGNHRESLRVSTVTSYRRELHAVLARNPFSAFPKSRAFFAATEEPASYSADREDFLGRWNGRENPAALHFGRLSGKVGAGLDPGAALVLEIALAPGEQREIAFVLGAGEDERQAVELLTRYTQLEHAAAVPEAAQSAFRKVTNQVRVKTPDLAFDLFANHWLLYQVLSCRFWGRSAFFQSGGAYGYRDQLQDSMALLHARPELTREHLLVSAARQFIEGDVQHWWHPDTGEGVRTHCSDDLVWLPWAAIEYTTSTGDHDVWNELVPFLQERLLKPGEDDLYSVPPVSAESAPLYEHCVRALQAANTQGPNGLPLMRAGDWNDGMNRVGLEGRGESVWLGWFLGSVLARFASVAGARGDNERAAWCRAEAARLGAAIDASAWDGAWYRRATFDDGQPLGSHANAECRIDAIAQSWAVLSRLGRPERARQALDASLLHLLDREEKILKLLTPPFQGEGPDPGYIAAYPPGIRENGGQYTHGILWTVLALLQEGRGNEAHAVLAMLNAIRHTTDPADLAKYQVEPYVVAADVYSHEPHVGRGGWTWYTGSASWMYRISIEGILGLQRHGHELRIAPCVPTAWSKFEAEYRTPGGGRLLISYDNPHGVSRGVERLTLDGRTLPGDRVPLPEDAADHRVVVAMGQVGVKDEEVLGSARLRTGAGAPGSLHRPRG